MMDMGVGYNGHVYRHVGGTSCVNEHIFNSEIKKVMLYCGNLHFRDSAIEKRYIF